ncbi:MAG: PAS domain-containing sensor histidine kinase [Alphaproteobacteria bacterium]|nr:PAS domain-containing sensor histidine kinase [Alphaproteobacteria bacterium]
MVSEAPAASASGSSIVRVFAWLRQKGTGLRRKLAIALALAAGAAAVATYGALSSSPLYGAQPRTVLILLLADLILLLALGAVVARHLAQLWAERRRGLAGSRLHARLVAWFSAVAIAPAIIVAAFSGVIFNLGIQSWFSDRVRMALGESLAVAEAYTTEHRKVIQADILAMAFDLDREAPNVARNGYLFSQLVTTQARLRSLSEAIVFDSSGRILARTPLSFGLAFDAVMQSDIARARVGEVVFLTSETEDRVRALIRLDRLVNSYLYVSRFVEPDVLLHVARTKRAVAEFELLELERSGIEIAFALTFLMVALLLLLVAVWFGLRFATRLVQPLGELIGAAEQVRGGDLGARVAEGAADDEISTLGRAFNRMTNQLASQRADIMEANAQLDSRRRFTEAVLAGVSAGVIGVDRDGRINLPNRSAADLLGTDVEVLVGRSFADAAPEMADMIAEAMARPSRLVQRQLTLARPGTSRRLLARVAAQQTAGTITGFVVTFDDVTELEYAQRTAAWGDVARRVAHEIKNPLTPIRLSAERLKRKYGDQITRDSDVFTRCIDTIIRQVVYIGRMVDEFSSFARMPPAVLGPEDLRELASRSVLLQSEAHPEIDYRCVIGTEPVVLACDERQVSQALTNLLQNAADAIAGRVAVDGAALPGGEITVSVQRHEDAVILEVADNGRGLPVEERDRLAEPYVTTRARGTGLGLAIVKRVIEDHDGQLVLEDRPGGGARVRMVFPSVGRATAVIERVGDGA